MYVMCLLAHAQTRGINLHTGHDYLSWLSYKALSTAQAANISEERLASFDRPIKSEPKFSKEQCPGLKKDLTAYLQTLKASHSGTCMS